MSTRENLKNIVEAILFASGDPISVSAISTSLDVEPKEINRVIEELSEEYEKRESGITILRMNSSVQMSTSEKYADLVEDILSPIRSEKLTKSAIEVLSIVAYRQPITRSEIADIRGVRSDYLLNTLIKKDMVKECGHKDTLGHPAMFATTEVFLRDFNLKDISQLPKLDYSAEEDSYELLDIDNLPAETLQEQNA